MIPKKIHYCWFGGKPLPELARRCIASWRQYLPDYEIVEWNESNFDVRRIPYTAEAYEAGKYAFVSDYARFRILYEQGGLYFDTDVEVLAPMDDIIARGPFMGIEQGRDDNAVGVAPGLGLGVNPGLAIYKEILDFYSTLHFLRPDGSLDMTTVVQYTSDILARHGYNGRNELQQVAGVWIYPWQYFCPMNFFTNEVTLTPETRTIHLYNASWHGKSLKFREWVRNHLGGWAVRLGVIIKRPLKWLGICH